jgi:hypothetical protein
VKLTAIKNKVTSTAGRQVLHAQKHSPTLLFAFGVTGVVTTVVLASRATLKMDEILEEVEKKRAQIDETIALDIENYQPEDAVHDGNTLRVQTALKIAKLYTPAVAVGMISIACLTGSHYIMSRRNIALTATLAGVDRMFKEYRSRVVDELGVEKDQEFRYGTVETEITVETDEGPKKKTVKVVDKHKDPYTFLFDQVNSKNWDKIPAYNQTFLNAQQDFANQRLQAYGHVFLNEILDSLGFDRTPAGAVTGWIKDAHQTGDGDGYIDFGIMRDLVRAKEFLNGEAPAIWLEFNVDGPIYNKI